MPQGFMPLAVSVCRQRVRGTTVERAADSATGKENVYVPEKFAKLW